MSGPAPDGAAGAGGAAGVAGPPGGAAGVAGPPAGAAGSPAAGSPPAGRTFEELMTELEAMTERLAAGDLGIEAAADLYEQAERLHAQAAERLAQVQARVEALTSPRLAPGPAGGDQP